MLLTIAGEAATRPIKRARSFIVVKSVVLVENWFRKGIFAKDSGAVHALPSG
jgi:hypothetical protein